MVDIVKNNQTPPPEPDPSEDNESNPGDRKEISIAVAVGIAIIIAGVLLVVGILAYRSSDVTTEVDMQSQQDDGTDQFNQEETNQIEIETEATPEQTDQPDSPDLSDTTTSPEIE